MMQGSDRQALFMWYGKLSPRAFHLQASSINLAFMNPQSLLILALLTLFIPVIAHAQSNAIIKIDGNSVSADPERGIKLPSWLTAGQTLAADQDVYWP